MFGSFMISFYSPHMVVTIYDKIQNENDLTKKKNGKTKQMACTCLNGNKTEHVGCILVAY